MSGDGDANHAMSTGPIAQDVLVRALGEGDPDRVRSLIDAGADIHYRRAHRYDALIDAVHGRRIDRDPRLLELLGVLIRHGVDLGGVSDFGETALRVLSSVGRFDAVRLLLEAGADRSQLKWTGLMEAVALGSIEDVEGALAQGAGLEDRDSSSRTAWHIALLRGDLDMVRLLRERGARADALGPCDRPALFFAIEGRHPEVLRWLLDEGADVEQTDEFGRTALMEAVEQDDPDCVEILLEAGADAEVESNGTALSWAESREVVQHLLNAGADPAHLSQEGQRALLGLGEVRAELLAGVDPRDYQGARTRRFGRQNPERMDEPFWIGMIRSGVRAHEARERFEGGESGYNEPVWCAQRFGQSLTLLGDGRAVQIGGEHEDFYDPDFCIYNDVFVHDVDGSITIYGYPETVFPPTDFHTATAVDRAIIVIGRLGYSGSRRYGETPVYRLDIGTMRMERLELSGPCPGWLYKHRAEAVDSRTIRVWGGTVVTGGGGGEEHEENHEAFVLDLERLCWRRLVGG